MVKTYSSLKYDDLAMSENYYGLGPFLAQKNPNNNTF